MATPSLVQISLTKNLVNGTETFSFIGAAPLIYYSDDGITGATSVSPGMPPMPPNDGVTPPAVEIPIWITDIKDEVNDKGGYKNYSKPLYFKCYAWSSIEQVSVPPAGLVYSPMYFEIEFLYPPEPSVFPSDFIDDPDSYSSITISPTKSSYKLKYKMSGDDSWIELSNGEDFVIDVNPEGKEVWFFNAEFVQYDSTEDVESVPFKANYILKPEVYR